MGTEAFAEALDAAMKRRQTNQSKLGRAAGASPAMLSAWLLGRVNQPDPDKVFAVERALELSPGELSQHLGFMPVPEQAERRQPVTFRDWLVEHGEKLTDRQRETLENTYAEFVEKTTAVEDALAEAEAEQERKLAHAYEVRDELAEEYRQKQRERENH